ncbi:hypothetical protein [Planctomycetes bacterium TBK1r]|uniref:Uncharacterized protein n=1 Tax=Stieleria magnilauensis TaxID=2527963 RepID=A0ABX5XQD9_9BACT|nr:hypothetical protein TBK1r_31680 [Planctomycetes bacterium TBK1r]
MDQQLPRGRVSATEPVLRSRLLPRISFQSLLVLTAFSAVVIAVVYAADQGGPYATAAAVGLFFAVCMFVCSAFIFLLSWAVSFLPRVAGVTALVVGIALAMTRLLGIPLGMLSLLQETIWLINFQIIGWFLLLYPFTATEETDAASPFAGDQLPPQIFAPREPSN